LYAETEPFGLSAFGFLASLLPLGCPFAIPPSVRRLHLAGFEIVPHSPAGCYKNVGGVCSQSRKTKRMKLSNEHMQLLRRLREHPMSQRETASPVPPFCEELERAGYVRFTSAHPSWTVIEITEVGRRALGASVVAHELVTVSGSDNTIGAALALARVTVGSYLSRSADVEASRFELRQMFADQPGSDTPIGRAILRWLDRSILRD